MPKQDILNLIAAAGLPVNISPLLPDSKHWLVGFRYELYVIDVKITDVNISIEEFKELINAELPRLQIVHLKEGIYHLIDTIMSYYAS